MHFDAFLRQVCPPLDLDWRKYRRRAARHRVQARMTELGLTEYEEYLRFLSRVPAEADGLADLMRVTVSRFFREAPRWKTLEEKVLPQLLVSAGTGRRLRAWSVGCAGGEEPYTLALLWSEFLQTVHPRHRLDILASDIDRSSLERAERALYRPSSLREVPQAIREKYFAAKNDHWQLESAPKAAVEFRRQNFMTGPPPGTFDLVLARYLPFTYYRGERRLEAARRLWRALRPGGALMIGAKEQLGKKERQLFAPWPGAEGVFRRRFPGGQLRPADFLLYHG
jgi:chemotaxis protein methyltransferase CheR